MNLSDKINAFEKLGFLCRNLVGEENNPIFQQILLQNECFTKQNVIQSLIAVSNLLIRSEIEKWIYSYDLNLLTKSKKIGVFLAGNIPLVGFHDFLCVLILNHKFIAKLSSKDSILFNYLINQLLIIEPRFKSKIFLQSNILDSDIFICTGNDFSAKYFDFKFNKKPKIIRGSKTSVAILDGKETDKDIKLLMKDVFLYFGLGCRSVTKLYIPKNYNIESLKKYFLQYKYFLKYRFYVDNYKYYKAIYEFKKDIFFHYESMLLLESKELFSPISVLYYEHYNEITDISVDFSKIQCVVSKNNNYNSIPFGASQNPTLFDYADNIDTIDFLLKN